jgi:hypothetical protein
MRLGWNLRAVRAVKGEIPEINEWVERERRRHWQRAYQELAAVNAQQSGALESKLQEILDAVKKLMPPASPPHPCSHADDFTSVRWFGVQHDFAKGLQAESIRHLWEAWEQGGHGLSEQTIGEKAGSGSNRFRLYHVFAPYDRTTRKRTAHPAWGTMIRPAGKGRYRLAPPDDAGTTA